MSGSKQQVFYIHGGESYQKYEDFLERLKTQEIRDLPDADSYVKWTEHLAADLGENYEVFMPLMPNKQNAKYDEWKIWFERHFEYLHDGVILVGCSLGAMFFYRYLIEETIPFSIKAAILMASPLPELYEKDFEDSGDFTFATDDVKKVTVKAEKIVIMHSIDDFLVPYEHAVELSKVLPEAEFITFADKNHFLVPELPELVAKIKEIAAQ